MLVLVTALLVQELTPAPRVLAWSLAISLVLSKGWLYINQFDPTLGQPLDHYPRAVAHPGAEYTWNFPFQAYWMNFGPWTSNQFLLVQAVVLLALLVSVRKLYGKPNASLGSLYNEVHNS